jgi:hypothetical protein
VAATGPGTRPAGTGRSRLELGRWLGPPRALSLAARGRLCCADLVTHRFPLAGIGAAFRVLRDRDDDPVKVVIVLQPVTGRSVAEEPAREPGQPGRPPGPRFHPVGPVHRVQAGVRAQPAQRLGLPLR